MKLSDVQIESSRRYKTISLTKLCGKTIADIEVSLSTEFDGVTVKLYKIVFTDGTSLFCEGEHDLPYVTDSTEPILPSEEILSALHREETY